jgi:hypothetical protein
MTVLCVQCVNNALEFRVGKIIAPDGSSALGVTAIICKNLGTGLLSKCRYTPGDPLFTHLTSLYLAQVEFDRQYEDVRSRYDLEVQILMGKINTIIFAMKEDSLVRAQAGTAAADHISYKPISAHWNLDGTEKPKDDP